MATLHRNNVQRATLALACLAIFAGSQVEAFAADWPQFLGPDRNGISSETGLIEQWPADGPREVWRVKGGVGMSAVSVAAGLALTLAQDADSQFVVALDAKTGDSKWSTAIAPSYRNQMGNGPRGTPAISGDVVFAYSGEGVLAALEMGQGKILWSRNLVKEYDGKPADYGMACSPIVWNDLVIVHTGAARATVVACDVKSGETRWTAGTRESAGYSSPTVLKVGQQEQLVAFTGASVAGVDLKTGEKLWQYPYRTDYDCNIASPISIKGDVFISSGENHGSTLLRIKSSGSDYSVTEVWASTGTGSSLRNEWQTSILIDGHLYGFDNVGSAGPVSHLACVNAATGQGLWRPNRFGKGNLIAADGKFFVSTMKGELIVLTASPDGFKELGRKTVLETTRQAPSIANGLLYLRDDQHVVCFDVRR
jgi:outer membrane protein assembly factor BamB